MVLGDLPRVERADPNLPGSVELGAFSISLNVKDLDASRVFYEALGFEVAGGDPEQNYLIMKNGESTIGLFYGMFEGQILTFNPGLTNRMELLDEYLDIRQIQSRLSDAGLELTSEIDTGNAAGPASITLVDPDGNSILIDQFF